MSLYDKYRETDYLDDVSFIAGTRVVLNFSFYTADGNPINVKNSPSSSMKWVLGRYGDPSAYVYLNKTASFSPDADNVFTITLDPYDTLALGGDVYLQQPIITDGKGHIIRPGQGIVIIRRAIPTTN